MHVRIWLKCASVCVAQENNVSVAALEQDPFVNCYRGWLKEKQFSSGTGADFLASCTRTSGALFNLKGLHKEDKQAREVSKS